MFCRVLNPSLPEVWKQASGRPLGEIAQENKGTLTVWAFSDGRVSAFPSFCLVLFPPPNTPRKSALNKFAAPNTVLLFAPPLNDRAKCPNNT